MVVRKDEVTVDLSDVSSSLELQNRLITSLGFPGRYGRNRDAFWDAITGLVDMPHRLRFVGCPDFADRHPRDAKQLRECFARMRAELPAHAAVVAYD